ncbi:hypothetical protein J3459_015945 [Metarhizium acridum]|nr:hypothetical protein J3459_015945 [Metarhizium acridum]
MNIFAEVPLFMFKIMQQCVGFQEIADDEKLLRRTFSTYRRLRRLQATLALFSPGSSPPRHVWRLLMAAVLERKRVDDSVQFLLDKGESNYNVVEFIFTVFVAGLTTTTFTCSWLVLFLGRHEEWKRRCRQEIDQVLAKHRESTVQTPNDILKSLSLQEWESCFPVVGICLRETLRLQLPGTMFRRNASGIDVPIGSSGEVIPNGAYAAYAVADVHLNPELYPEPHEFNPGRYLDSPKTHPEEAHSYLGWGSGRHVCGK